MRKIGVVALVFALSSCATVRQPQAISCDGKQSYQEGFSDGERSQSLRRDFGEHCTAESKPLAVKRYREGFAEGRGKLKPEPAQVTKERPNRVIQTIPSDAWICEVEASSKIFTGVGHSLAEARISAQNSCGAHFRASSCQQSECKQSL